MRIPRTIKDEELCSAFILVAEYAKNKRMLRETENDMRNATAPKPEVAIFGKGKTGDATATTAIHLIEPSFKGNGRRLARLRVDTEPVDKALKELEGKPQGEKIRTCIDLVYWNENGFKSIDAAARKVHLDGSYMGHMIREFIRRVDYFKYNEQ